MAQEREARMSIRRGISSGGVVAAAFPPSLRRSLGLRHTVLPGALALALAYYGAAQLGYALEFAGPVGSVVWLPAGVGIAFVYFGGAGLWPGLLLGDLLANDYSAMPLGSAIGQTCGNVLEVLVAASLLHRLVRKGSPLDSAGGIFRMLVALAASTAISATVGPLSLLAGGVLTADSLPHVARTWWLGDFSGALIVVTLALACWPPRPLSFNGRRLEAALLITAVLVVSEFTSRNEGSWTYLAFCALVWSALRFGQRGASLCITIVVGFTVWNTMHYDGPFSSPSGERGLLSTQLFIAVATLSTVWLAAVVAERERIAEELGASRARLSEAADGERRRLERNLHDGAQQRLVALAIRLRLAGDQVANAPLADASLLRDAAAQLQLALEELRELAHGIHPNVLSQGLAGATRHLAASSSVPVVVSGLPTARLDPAVEATAYYVLAEAVTNAQKHAGCSQISVSVAVGADAVSLEIADDGAGGADERAGTGLLGLRRRVEASGGSFELESPPGGGTRLTAQLPVESPPAG
jgi:signal transduction histidine kinase